MMVIYFGSLFANPISLPFIAIFENVKNYLEYIMYYALPFMFMKYHVPLLY